jgi:prophage tail gpP-like protein
VAITDATNPVIGEITLKVTNGSKSAQFDRFLSCELTEDYLSPSDSGSFDIDEKELSTADAEVLVTGAKYQISINGAPQSVGIIDEVISNVDRGSGTVIHVETRDWMAPMVDGQVDPRIRFTPNQTLLDVLEKVAGQFGATAFATDNVANRNVITGRVYGTPTSKKGKPLKSYVLHEEKPFPNEGAFAFMSRISQRFGLWLRPAVDGHTIIVGKPDFDQAPRYGLQLAYGDNSLSNNVEKGHFARSRKEQPSILYASGFGAGGDFPKSKLRSGIVNPVVNADNSAIINAYPDVKLQSVDPVTAAFPPFIEQIARAAFLYDSSSHTQAQLDAYVLRELSLRMRKALVARYEIMGHMLNGQPVSIDTIVNVNDQRKTVQWQGPLWLLGRKFSSSASSGKRTNLDLILPGSLVF